MFHPDMHEWLSGGVSPCQGEGRGFESRLVLQSRELEIKGFPEFPGTLLHDLIERFLTVFLTNCNLHPKRAFLRFSGLLSCAWISLPFPGNNFVWCWFWNDQAHEHLLDINDTANGLAGQDDTTDGRGGRSLRGIESPRSDGVGKTDE